MLKEFYRLQILVAAVLVRNPFPVLASVIQIEHRGNRVYPKSVDMIFFHPVKGIGKKEILDLRASVIENLGSPVRMLPLSGIRMLVDRVAVKIRKPLLVLRKMSRHPVQNNAYFVFVKIIDQEFKILRSPISGCRRIIPCYLIAPGGIQRMFRNSHKLYMRVAHVLYVFHNPSGKFPVIIKSLRILLGIGMLHPAAGMHLVNGKSRCLGREFFPVFQPRRVSPFIGNIRNTGSCSGPFLRPEGIRIGLVEFSPVAGNDEIFVHLPDLRAGNKYLKDTHVSDLLHGIGFLVPAVKLSDHIDRHGIRRPDRKPGTGLSVHHSCVRAHFFIQFIMRRLSEKILVQITKNMGILLYLLFRLRFYRPCCCLCGCRLCSLPRCLDSFFRRRCDRLSGLFRYCLIRHIFISFKDVIDSFIITQKGAVCDSFSFFQSGRQIFSDHVRKHRQNHGGRADSHAAFFQNTAGHTAPERKSCRSGT